MKRLLKFIINLIPSKKLRHKLRNRYIYKLQTLNIENGNNINISDNFPCNIQIKGKNNFVSIGKSNKIKNINISFIGNNNKIIIGDDFEGFLTIYLDLTKQVNNCSISIGNKCYSGGCNYFIAENNTIIEVGNGCMFSDSIIFNASDFHSVIDNVTKELLNIGKSIIIGNHVWIGRNVQFTKNTQVSDNSIVGLGSIITKKFVNPNVVIAGNPAIIVKNNINWDRKAPDVYLEEMEHDCHVNTNCSQN